MQHHCIWYLFKGRFRNKSSGILSSSFLWSSSFVIFFSFLGFLDFWFYHQYFDWFPFFKIILIFWVVSFLTIKLWLMNIFWPQMNIMGSATATTTTTLTFIYTECVISYVVKFWLNYQAFPSQLKSANMPRGNGFFHRLRIIWLGHSKAM